MSSTTTSENCAASQEEDEEEEEENEVDLELQCTQTSSSSCACPLCLLVIRNKVALFQHINASHISRHEFPDVGFLDLHQRRVCSTCGFVYEKRFVFCQRSQEPGQPRCRGNIVNPCLYLHGYYIILTTMHHLHSKVLN